MVLPTSSLVHPQRPHLRTKAGKIFFHFLTITFLGRRIMKIFQQQRNMFDHFSSKNPLWSSDFSIFVGYRDAEGFVTLSVSLDTDPCLSVMVVTRWAFPTIWLATKGQWQSFFWSMCKCCRWKIHPHCICIHKIADICFYFCFFFQSWGRYETSMPKNMFFVENWHGNHFTHLNISPGTAYPSTRDQACLASIKSSESSNCQRITGLHFKVVQILGSG